MSRHINNAQATALRDSRGYYRGPDTKIGPYQEILITTEQVRGGPDRTFPNIGAEIDDHDDFQKLTTRISQDGSIPARKIA